MYICRVFSFINSLVTFSMVFLSKAKLVFFKSLLEKKYRNQERLFLVEGIKMYQEAYKSTFEIFSVVILEDQLTKISPFLNEPSSFPIYIAEASAFKSLSSHNSPEGIITIIHFPSTDQFGQTLQQVPSHFLTKGPSFLLENIQDPGNVGTILRIADWFGIEHVICTEGTADVLNPKTLRASMGAIFRVKIAYIKEITPEFLSQSPQLYAADMQGTPLSTTKFSENACIILGNEANGISSIGIEHAQTFTIPGIGAAESLNVGVAAGIIAYQLKILTNTNA